ncbi:hypothetical protein HPO96_00430 [Kribbella sandramycini]|uniref:Uncharacterized protein n=1 Tax=Kribbella sandramycini TaxID=60450 RepID=A0A7Y4NWE1_9ACTN|nr:hypothetical protein [Kribbella sandramycini]MBB6568715.1 hypothetical protein [Kribbella sandramycini]NOL38702.1 hypothetical protein [Kribbella sandramycini]
MIGPGRVFPAEYEAQLTDLPAAGGADVELVAGSRGSIFVTIEPSSGPAWTGEFGGEALVRTAATGLYPTPSPVRLCVVDRGTAFLADVLAPARSEQLEIDDPVMDVRPAVSERLLLLIGRWTITAVGPDGIVWTSPRIAFDGLRVDEIGDGLLRGVADPEDDEPRDFAVDLRTAQVVGGAGID